MNKMNTTFYLKYSITWSEFKYSRVILKEAIKNIYKISTNMKNLPSIKINN